MCENVISTAVGRRAASIATAIAIAVGNTGGEVEQRRSASVCQMEPRMTCGTIEPELVVLEGCLTIRMAPKVCDRLREALEASPCILIDCDGAESVDLSFVQLLISASVRAERASGFVALARRPDGELLRVLTCAGFRVAPGPGVGNGYWFDRGSF
jgi:anti-anti-sigma regulatory factor